jgi:hypothetical protein
LRGKLHGEYTERHEDVTEREPDEDVAKRLGQGEDSVAYEMLVAISRGEQVTDDRIEAMLARRRGEQAEVVSG